MNSEPILIGNIDERGYLSGFTKRGYTPAKCLLELVANILDSQDKVQSHKLARKAIFDIQRIYTKLIDNGFGMNKEAISDMFSLHRENHSNDASRGVAGIGAKPSLSILSQETSVAIFTRKINGEYLFVSVPWDIIHKEGRYTGMISIRTMSDIEKAEFIRDRSENSMMNGNEYHGTTIRFQTNNLLEDIILENFEDIQSSSLLDPLDRISVVFGKENTEFIMKHYEKKEAKKLELYNYFKGNQAEFITGISEDIIEQYSNIDGSSYRFIWRKLNGEAWEILKVGKGWSTKPELSTTNSKSLIHVGNFTVKTGFRVDPSIFDPDHPTDVPNNNSYGNYVESFIGKSPLNHEFVAFNKIYRNNQVLGLVNPEISIGNSRANPEAHFEIDLVQCEIYFNPISSQNNLQDKAMGTQENKNQFNPNGTPKNFSRLIKGIKHEKYLQIWNTIKEAITLERNKQQNNNNVIKDLESISDNQSQSESESESDQEEKTDNKSLKLEDFIPITKKKDDTQINYPTPPGIKGQDLLDVLVKLENLIDADILYNNTKYMHLFNIVRELLQ